MILVALLLAVALLVTEIRRRLALRRASAGARAAAAVLAEHERYHVSRVAELTARLLIAQERARRPR